MNELYSFLFELYLFFTVTSVQQNFGVAVDSLQHKTHNEIYGIDAFYDQ